MQNIIANFMGYKKILSTFPELYNYRGFSPLILRCSVGGIFLFSGWYQFSQRNGWRALNMVLGFLKITVGTFLILGMYTQVFAITGSIISIFNIMLGIKNREGIDNIVYNFLMLAITLALTLTGPGVFAFDISL